ncbi:MAG: DUF4493 domain-containing protein [Bacteroidales bacterium]|nr:DUF4493 domain-containing protein [Bacteroidales bacterium]
MKNIKKYILSTILLIFFACSADSVVQEYEKMGEVSFELQVDKELVSSRSALPVVPDEINLDIVPDDKTTGTEKRYMLSSTNGVFKRKSILAPGTYNCKAYSYSSVDRALKEGERGVAWFYSELAPDNHFEISTENTTPVNLVLKVANSKISLVKNGDFTNEEIFALTKAAVYTADATSRKLEYPLMDGTEYGWFKANQDIMVQVFFTYKGQKYYKMLNIGEKSIAANHHIITMKPSLGGIGSITIQVDNGLEVEHKIVVLNVDGSILIGSASGIYKVAVDNEIDKSEGGIDFNPEE